MTDGPLSGARADADANANANANANAKPRRSVMIVAFVDVVLASWAIGGPLGLLWLLANRAHEDQCAAMGVIPLQGPVIILMVIAGIASLAVGRTPRERMIARVPAAALAIAEVVYWTLFFSLPDASKC